MSNNIAIGARLKDALQGPCRYFLIATGIFAIIAAFFLFTKPHFESGGFEDYPWRIFYGAFVIPLAITKALLASALISYLYKASTRKNLSWIICSCLLPISLVWSFLASDHPDNISLKLYDGSDIQTDFYLHHTASLENFKYRKEKIIDLYEIPFGEQTKHYSCTLGDRWSLGNLSARKMVPINKAISSEELTKQLCEVTIIK